MSLHWIICSHLHSVYTVKSSLHFKWEFDKMGNLSADEVNGCYPWGLGRENPCPLMVWPVLRSMTLLFPSRVCSDSPIPEATLCGAHHLQAVSQKKPAMAHF